MPHTADLGDLITRLGAAWDAGEITLATAVDQLRAADPTLTQLGATGQIKAWRTASTRYRAAVAYNDDTPDTRRVSAAALRREPIVFKAS